jgi:hypothetical protein
METQIQNKHAEACLPRLVFETTISMFEWVKALHALDDSATVIDKILNYL